MLFLIARSSRIFIMVCKHTEQLYLVHLSDVQAVRFDVVNMIEFENNVRDYLNSVSSSDSRL